MRNTMIGSASHRSLLIGGMVVVIVVAGALLVWAGYSQHWIRFDQNALRAWLELLIALTILIGGARLFNLVIRKNEQRTQRELKIAEWYAQHERDIEFERLRETAFQTYLDRMTELLLEKSLRQSEAGGEVRDIARARTLTALRGLDGPHKGILLRFLYEADLIKSPSIIDLTGADLSGAHLKKVDLSAADLHGVDLSGADLSGADLSKANLQETTLIVADLSGTELREARLGQANLTEAVLVVANLNEADLSNADLHGANLEGADLIGVNLQEADLHNATLIVTNLIEANLAGANLAGANLEAADLIEANLAGADLNRANLTGASLRGARYNSQTKWPKGLLPATIGAVLVE